MSHYNHKQFKYIGRYDPSYTRVVMIEKHNVNIMKISSNFHYRMQTVLNLIRQAQDKTPLHSIVVPTSYLTPTVKKILEELGCSCHNTGTSSSYVEWPEGLEI